MVESLKFGTASANEYRNENKQAKVKMSFLDLLYLHNQSTP